MPHRPIRPTGAVLLPAGGGRRFGHRARVGVVLAAALVLWVVGCGAQGGSIEQGEPATEVEQVCAEIPSIPSDPDDLSVEEPYDSERYDAGDAALRLTAADGEERCLTLELDVERTQGWQIEANRIDLTYGRADGPTVRLRTTGEPMAGFVDASLEITDGDGGGDVALTTPRRCALVLAQMAEGRLEAWIDCPEAPRGSDDLAAISGHLTATLT